MKKVLLSLGAFLIGVTSFAQQEEYPEVDEPCATTHYHEHRYEQNPDARKAMQEAERKVQKFLKDNPDFMRNRDDLEITIPVVFHVLHHPDSPEQNIPDELIHSQIDVLNEDFAKMNDSSGDIRDVFDTISVDTKIQFCLASFDPDGEPTDGITRTETEADFGFTFISNNAKYTDQGGKDAWPTDQYLNIWVCDMSFLGNPAVLGYAQFPEAEMDGNMPMGSAETDGVVMQYQYIGRTESAETAPSNLGRVTTHEVGHWLGLRHIWGDGDCDSTDYVYDTPLMDGQSDFDCDQTKNTCDDSNIGGHWGSIDPPDMVENFMDYSADACMAAFTRGQSERMWAFLMTDVRRNALFDSHGCVPEPEIESDITTTDSNCNQGDGCDGDATVTPVAGEPDDYTYAWNDPNNQTGATATDLCPGTYEVVITDGNGEDYSVYVVIGGPSPINASYTSVDATCDDCEDGSIQVDVTGGTAPYSYDWSGGITGENIITDAAPGTYTVTVTDDCGEETTIEVTVGYDETTSIANFENGTIKIYPNPAKDFVQVEAEVNGLNITVFNAVGQIVHAESMENTTLKRINTSNFDAGVYIFKLSNDDMTTTMKVVVQ